MMKKRTGVPAKEKSLQDMAARQVVAAIRRLQTAFAGVMGRMTRRLPPQGWKWIIITVALGWSVTSYHLIRGGWPACFPAGRTKDNIFITRPSRMDSMDAAEKIFRILKKKKQ